MKNIFALVLAAAITAPGFAQPSASTAPRPAPEFAINMPEGGQKLLSSYRGKPVLLALFYTTCPHCQDMARTLSSQIVPEYGPKGVQFIAAAFDEGAKAGTPEFIKNYVNGFPMGYVDRGQVNEFLQKSIMTVLYVPILVFIDRKGVIDTEVLGDNTFLSDPPKNIRATLDKMLAKQPAKPVTHLSKNLAPKK